MIRAGRTGWIAMLLAACAGAPPVEDAGASPPDVDSLVAANTAFAVDLYGQLRDAEGNLALSPASVSVALAMTYAGARGETASEMSRVLHLDEVRGPVHAAFRALLARWADTGADGPELRVANRLFGDQATEFHQEFVGLTEREYGSELEGADFRGTPEAGRLRINQWVEERTADRIRNLLPPGSITVDARLVLVNAIYFRGLWREPFDVARTQPLQFHRPGLDPVEVPTMRRTGRMAYAALEGVQVLRIPYAGETLALYVLLPDAIDGIEKLEWRMTADKLVRWLDAVRVLELEVLLPRFTIDPPAAVKLQSALSKLGMPLAFDRNADFTGISDERPLYIHDAYHKAFVEVNEEGTEAAAATGVVVGIESAPVAGPRIFRADHPFLFLIRDLRNGSILFLGRVSDPRGTKG